jgi:hypothetical protein
MIIYYDISKDDLVPDAYKVAKILCQGMAEVEIRNQIESEKFRTALKNVRTNFFHMLTPFSFTKTIPLNVFREVFEESLQTSSPVYKAVPHWHYAAVFVVTIGNFIDLSVERLQMEGNFFDSTFLDASASVLVESVAEITQKRWMSQLDLKFPREGFIYATRYSPGYCGWDISGQTPLFGYAADADIPVKLMDDFSLQPRKSISGVFVIEEQEPGVSLERSCSTCDDRCRYMRTIGD